MIKIFCRHKDKTEIDKYYKCYLCVEDDEYNIIAYIVYKCNKCSKVIEKRIFNNYVDRYGVRRITNLLEKKGYKDEHTYNMQIL